MLETIWGPFILLYSPLDVARGQSVGWEINKRQPRERPNKPISHTNTLERRRKVNKKGSHLGATVNWAPRLLVANQWLGHGAALVGPGQLGVEQSRGAQD